MNGETARGETRRYGRSAFQLSAALGLAGVLTYVFFGLASHSLSADEYGEIVILWTAVFLVAATLFRPIEHLLARTLAERHRAGDPTRCAPRGGDHPARVLPAGGGRGARRAKEPIQDNLFSKEPASSGPCSARSSATPAPTSPAASWPDAASSRCMPHCS